MHSVTVVCVANSGVSGARRLAVRLRQAHRAHQSIAARIRRVSHDVSGPNMWVTGHAHVCDAWRADTPLTACGSLCSACCSVQMPRQQIGSADSSSSSSSSIIHTLQRILQSRITSLSCTARTAEQERRARRASLAKACGFGHFLLLPFTRYGCTRCPSACMEESIG